MKNCKICGCETRKDRNVCYGCRCTEKFAKNGGNTRNTRLKRAFRNMEEKPSILQTIFGL
jgi:hypothetical protein